MLSVQGPQKVFVLRNGIGTQIFVWKYNHIYSLLFQEIFTLRQCEFLFLIGNKNIMVEEWYSGQLSFFQIISVYKRGEINAMASSDFNEPWIITQTQCTANAQVYTVYGRQMKA